MLKTQKILKTDVNVNSFSNVLKLIYKWSNELKSSKYICLFNVHMCMEVYDNDIFSKVVNESDLVLADGFPIYIGQKLFGNKDAQQIRGVDLTLEVAKMSQKHNFSIGFLGGTDSTLKSMINVFKTEYQIHTIEYYYSPPFRELTDNEKENIINDINKSGIKILFVGLGCPKQEFWMHENRNKLKCIMIGVGAAFDFISGNKKEAPRLMQIFGLEWFYRFISEPNRLWKRYLKHNPRFIYYFILQYFENIRR